MQYLFQIDENTLPLITLLNGGEVPDVSLTEHAHIVIDTEDPDNNVILPRTKGGAVTLGILTRNKTPRTLHFTIIK